MEGVDHMLDPTREQYGHAGFGFQAAFFLEDTARYAYAPGRASRVEQFDLSIEGGAIVGFTDAHVIHPRPKTIRMCMGCVIAAASEDIGPGLHCEVRHRRHIRALGRLLHHRRHQPADMGGELADTRDIPGKEIFRRRPSTDDILEVGLGRFLGFQDYGAQIIIDSVAIGPAMGDDGCREKPSQMVLGVKRRICHGRAQGRVNKNSDRSIKYHACPREANGDGVTAFEPRPLGPKARVTVKLRKHFLTRLNARASGGF